jgi:hypothetical protein
MVNEQLPWLKPFTQQDQPGLAWRDQMNAGEHGFSSRKGAKVAKKRRGHG